MRTAAALAAAAVLCSGCASMIPSTPATQAAEGAWVALDAIDTAQSTHFDSLSYAQQHYRGHGAVLSPYPEDDPFARALYGGPHPGAGRVIATNVALALVHSTVSAWFDRHVAAAQQSDSDTLGLWYCGRIAWWVVSFAGTGASVAHNAQLGLQP